MSENAQVSQTVENKTVEDAGKVTELRRKLLSDHMIQMILSGLTEGSVTKIEPVFDSDRMPRYPIIENIAKISPTEAVDLLDKMKDAGILARSFYERAILCPYCKSPASLFVHHKCPKCGALEIDRTNIWEHAKCGSVWEAKTAPEETKCPKCGIGVSPDSEAFHVVGMSWLCPKCKIKFDRPTQTFYCRICDKESHIGDVRMLDIHSYSLNPEAAKEIQGALLLPVLKKTLEQCGYGAEMPGSLVGASGVPQDFTLLAKKNDKPIAADLVQAQEAVDVAQVLTLFAKLSDVKVEAGLLLVIPSISERARTFADSRGIVVLEGRDIKEVAAKLENFLKKR